MAGRPNDKIFKTMIKKHGSEESARAWFRQIGARGGSVSKNGGFGSDKIGKDGLSGNERARIAGSKGGRISRRGKVINK